MSSVISPGKRLQPAAADELAQPIGIALVHLGAGIEFDRAAQRISAGETDQATEIAIFQARSRELRDEIAVRGDQLVDHGADLLGIELGGGMRIEQGRLVDRCARID